MIGLQLPAVLSIAKVILVKKELCNMDISIALIFFYMLFIVPTLKRWNPVLGNVFIELTYIDSLPEVI